MKYVAFIDILGFKEKIKTSKQHEAVDFIRGFSSMLYRQWEGCRVNDAPDLNGFIVSDSIILYTNNTNPTGLILMIDFLINIYKQAFIEKGILLRGAIAKGDFDKIPSYSFDNLQKGLIVGSAYIEAYTLESSKKGALLIMKNNVKQDLHEYLPLISTVSIGKSEETKDELYSLRWADLDFILQRENLIKFIEMAKNSDWKPHYYQTLYLFMTNENNTERKMKLFSDIVDYLNTKYDYNMVDSFIEKSFVQEVDYHFKKMILSFIRNGILKAQNQNNPIENERLDNNINQVG